MPARYEEIRTALHRGFSVDNLRAITNLSLNTLQQKTPRHPSVFHAIALVCRWLADAWDGLPIAPDIAERVERQLRPPLEALLDIADGDPAQVCAALDNLATMFAQAVRSGLDSDLH